MIQPDNGQSLSQRTSPSATFSYSAQLAASEREAIAVSKEIPFPSAQLEKIYRRQRALRAQAAEDFATLNNWQVSLTPFALFALTPRHSVQPAITNYRQILFGDHPPVLFRENRPPQQPVAIVGQPRHANSDAARAVASKLGLELHLPANITASWWHPGEAAFFCFTRLGQEVFFLPEQMTTAERQDSALSAELISPAQQPVSEPVNDVPPSQKSQPSQAPSPPSPNAGDFSGPHTKRVALTRNMTTPAPDKLLATKQCNGYVTRAELKAVREQVRLVGIANGNWRETARMFGLSEGRVLNWVVRYGWKIPYRISAAPKHALRGLPFST
jgi:hypothetical protein